MNDVRAKLKNAIVRGDLHGLSNALDEASEAGMDYSVVLNSIADSANINLTAMISHVIGRMGDNVKPMHLAHALELVGNRNMLEATMFLAEKLLRTDHDPSDTLCRGLAKYSRAQQATMASQLREKFGDSLDESIAFAAANLNNFDLLDKMLYELEVDPLARNCEILDLLVERKYGHSVERLCSAANARGRPAVDAAWLARAIETCNVGVVRGVALITDPWCHSSPDFAPAQAVLNIRRREDVNRARARWRELPPDADLRVRYKPHSRFIDYGDTGLMLAARAGVFSEALERLPTPPTIDDFIGVKNNCGSTLASMLVDRGQVQHIFRLDIWRGRRADLARLVSSLPDKSAARETGAACLARLQIQTLRAVAPPKGKTI